MGQQKTLDPFLLFEEGIKKGENIKNNTVFRLDYLPEKIYERDQYRIIGREIGVHMGKGAGSSLLISGTRGTGKTLTVRYLLEESRKFVMERGIDLEVFYIPVRRFRNTYSILKEITSSKHGTPYDALMERAKKKLEEKKIILALDEVEFLEDTEILYSLSRETNAMILAIVTNPLWIKKLEDSIQSSFQPEPIIFPPYTATELSEILRQRAELGLYEYDEKGIELLSAIVASRFNGDARYGILALKRLGKENKWDEESVNNAVAKSVRDLELLLITALSPESLDLLSMIASHPDGMSTTELYHTFKTKWDISKPTFFTYLNDLEKQGLIGTGGGRRGKPYVVTLLLQYPELIKEEVKKKEVV
jgi:cell division control protein 6